MKTPNKLKTHLGAILEPDRLDPFELGKGPDFSNHVGLSPMQNLQVQPHLPQIRHMPIPTWMSSSNCIYNNIYDCSY